MALKESQISGPVIYRQAIIHGRRCQVLEIHPRQGKSNLKLQYKESILFGHF